ncbi:MULTISPECIES: DUF5324 family protein [Streptomyces]|uniref:Putative regulatory protein n=1 Tax=Streptomyces venezuelae (strain ATCC 10712 / CBS 650.69 / DSM 40230 / JCM 4526 / NBRC 13096 / PD 04745) TaxID=953739 RepID=F2RD33_STRVP|nr:DUF5324 family protein [Streptomyces venezuelae]APE22704.1 transcriptional regulator [Streptomyces venezuelae]QES00081.1 transcriptional regulator [Streptomyces venezuelae ATCC 10712]QES07131.1 transcriptional regulator [Streptomyces venezuelae]CCA56929.1 putative regulatory protein [Streptomyces venezuelae ATCC 10712]
MTRMDSVRAATGSAKESVLHAAEVVAPYAGTAKEQASHYAHEARVLLAPKVSKATQQARAQARAQYDSYVAPHVPPRVDAAAQRAAVKTRKACRQAADYTVPRVEHAVAATGPVLEEAGSRSTAAWAALRGQVTPGEIQKIVKKHERRARAGRLAKGLAVLGILAGGAFAAWKWWDKQANPDWLVEPPAPTEVDEGTGLTPYDDSEGSLDPEVEAKETEAEAAAAAEEAAERDKRR